MNKSNLEHTLFGLLIMGAIGLSLESHLSNGAWVAGYSATVAGFLFREVAQHEHHIYKTDTRRAFWKGFVYGWSFDSVMDFISPAIVCGIALWFKLWMEGL